LAVKTDELSKKEKMKTFTTDQVASHSTEKDCWIIVHSKVYDVTKFLKDHPGGKKVLLKVAGKDASKQFDQFHSQSVMEQYGPELQVGTIGNAVVVEKVEENLEGLEEGDAFGDGVPFGYCRG
jgi:cytochrome b involved in lipid metabolism